MKKTLYVECIPNVGHTKINEFYISCLENKLDTVYIEKITYPLYKKKENIHPLNVATQHPLRVIRGLFFLIATLKCIKIAKKSKIPTICFLSYDFLFFPITVIIAKLCGIRLFAFEHNTAPNSKLKKIIQSLCFTGVTRICFTPKNVELFQKCLGKAIYIPHPICSKNPATHPVPDEIATNKHRYKYIVFCPSGSTCHQRLSDQCRSYPDILFIIKTLKEIDLPNTISKPFFENYDALMHHADFIYIPINNNLKVSGPFYEAIGENKHIILNNSYFYDYSKSLFPNLVHNDEQNFNLLEIKTNKIDIAEYNNTIKKEFCALFK